MTLNPTLRFLGQEGQVEPSLAEKTQVRVHIQQRPRPEARPLLKRQPLQSPPLARTSVKTPSTRRQAVTRAMPSKRAVAIRQPRLPEPTVPRAEPTRPRLPQAKPMPGPVEPSESAETGRPAVPEPSAPIEAATPTASAPVVGVIPERAAVPKTSFPNANIRKALSRLGSKTSIELRLKIYPDGHIDLEVVTSSGEPELDRVVLQDLQAWRWEPARSAGRPVYSEKNLRLKLEAD